MFRVTGSELLELSALVAELWGTVACIGMPDISPLIFGKQLTNFK
jgi:hypothetical protein